MYQFYEKGIRGGQSVIFQKYAKANNPYLPDYDKNKPNSYILYLDANNLYGWAMNKKLPYSDFKWCDTKNISLDFIKNYDEDKEDYGYSLEVDLEYPKNIHDKHNNYPLCPLHYKPENSKTSKLCATLEDRKNYIISIQNLKQALEMGLILTKIHRVIKFYHKAWLKDWILLNTNFRKNAKNDFEKDYFKLMNNAVFGKCMENVRDRIDIKVALDEKYYKKVI